VFVNVSLKKVSILHFCPGYVHRSLMTIDYLIIGQGLAGSLLAWELIQRECKVVIIDNSKENASQVAAGLINPVTGMRFVKSADVDILLPTAKQYYLQLAEVFQQTFYIEKPMLRLFRSDKELIHCLKRLDDPDYQDYLGAVIPSNQTINNITTPFGFLEQKQTGYLLTRPLLTCLKDFFVARHCCNRLCAGRIFLQSRLFSAKAIMPQITPGFPGCHFNW
jgi:hypothetical protein